MSQPPSAVHVLTAFWTAVVSPVIARSSENMYASPVQYSLSLYEATANCASGWAVLTSVMMFATFVCTLASASPTLPVVSARNTMSGFGGIRGVIWLRKSVLVPPVGGTAPPLISVISGGAFLSDENKVVALPLGTSR